MDPASGRFPEGPRLDVPIVVDGEQMASLDFVREIGSEGYSHPPGGSPRRWRNRHHSHSSKSASAKTITKQRLSTIGSASGRWTRPTMPCSGYSPQDWDCRSSLSQINDPTIQEKVSRTIDMLDETIDDIRTAIFGLSPPTDASPRLRAEILEVAEDSAVALGFHPSLTFEGAVDNDVPETLVP